MKKPVFTRIARLMALLLPHFCTMVPTFHYLFQWADFGQSRLSRCAVLFGLVGILLVGALWTGHQMRKHLGYRALALRDMRNLSWRELLVWTPVSLETCEAAPRALLYIAAYSAVSGLLVGTLMALVACLVG